MNTKFEKHRGQLMREAREKEINEMVSINYWPGDKESASDVFMLEGLELANFKGLRVRYEIKADLKEVVAGLKEIQAYIEKEIEDRKKWIIEPTGICNNCGKVVKKFELIKISFIGHAYSQIPDFAEYIDVCEECSDKTAILDNAVHDGLSDLRTFSDAREEAKNWYESVKSFIDKAEKEKEKNNAELEEPERAKSKNNADFEMC